MLIALGIITALILISAAIYQINHQFDIIQIGLPPEAQHLLEKHSKFYQKLNQANKKKFQHRMRLFLKSKSIETFDGEDLNNEQLYNIAATAVRLTFGLRYFLMDHFTKIIVHPDEYYSSMTKKYHKGEANGFGVIIFSWKDFAFGNKEESDNINLGFHEFAHVIFLEYMKSNMDSRFMSYVNKWRDLVADENRINRIANSTLIRSYALTNEHEMFAVLMEVFFESPRELSREFPELYDTMTKMMNQDPTQPGKTIVKRFLTAI
jgi:Mlc titration factor MtfA (ptsG expression regulator)